MAYTSYGTFIGCEHGILDHVIEIIRFADVAGPFRRWTCTKCQCHFSVDIPPVTRKVIN